LSSGSFIDQRIPIVRGNCSLELDECCASNPDCGQSPAQRLEQMLMLMKSKATAQNLLTQSILLCQPDVTPLKMLQV
jgi:hypothetical protein